MNSSPPPASSIGYAWRGAIDAMGPPALVLMATLMGVGGLAHDAGFPIGATIFSTVFMWAGPAQVILFGSVVSGAALPAIALAVCFSSLRFLPMTVSLLPLVRRPGQRRWQMVLVAHLVSATNWTEGMRRLPLLPPQWRYIYFVGFSLTTLLAATLATGVGFVLTGELPVVLAAGLLLITPLFFAASLAAGARRVADWVALLLGFSLAPLAGYLLGPQFDILIGGVLGGSIAFFIHKRRRGR